MAANSSQDKNDYNSVYFANIKLQFSVVVADSHSTHTPNINTSHGLLENVFCKDLTEMVITLTFLKIRWS